MDNIVKTKFYWLLNISDSFFPVSILVDFSVLISGIIVTFPLDLLNFQSLGGKISETLEHIK